MLLGIGDDGAVLDLKALDNENLVMSTDTLVENVHFPSSINAGLIAKRALCTNLSDTAAMGAVPLWFTLSLTLPEENTTTAWLTDFSQGLFEEAQKFEKTPGVSRQTLLQMGVTLQIERLLKLSQSH